MAELVQVAASVAKFVSSTFVRRVVMEQIGLWDLSLMIFVKSAEDFARGVRD